MKKVYFLKRRIAVLVLELSARAQCHLQTTKMANMVLELSQAGQFRPYADMSHHVGALTRHQVS